MRVIHTKDIDAATLRNAMSDNGWLLLVHIQNAAHWVREGRHVAIHFDGPADAPEHTITPTQILGAQLLRTANNEILVMT